MPALDIDPEILRVTAAASAHAHAQALWHIDEEIKASNGIMEPLYATLTDEGPYAYMVWPQIDPDGSVSLPRLTTREEIVAAYEMIRGHSDLLEVVGLTEIRGTWYTFQDGFSSAVMKTDRETVHKMQTVALFPSGGASGITGELVWIRFPVEALGRPDEPDTTPSDELASRERVHRAFAAFLDGMRAADVDAVMAVLHDGVASTVRDYVNDTGTITDMRGTAAHRAYYEAFFERYDVHAVDLLAQVVEEWYVFAELRFTLTERATRRAVAFHTAEFWAPSKTGAFIARVGHGTEPAPR